MKKRITLIVVTSLLVIVVAAGFLRLIISQASNTERSIGQGVMVAGNYLPGNLSATSVQIKAPVDQSLATIASLTFQLAPSGKLATPMTIRFPLTRVVPSGSKLIVMTAESAKDPWTPMATTLSQNGKSASVSVTHLSLFEVVLLDISALAAAFKQEFGDGITANLFTKAVPPKCLNENTARGVSYAIASSKADTIYWCFGMQNGQRELVAVNNRDYVLAVQHPGLPITANSQATGGWGQLAQLVASTYHEALFFPAEAAQFKVDLQTGTQGGIKTQADGVSQLLYSLETGVDALFAITTHFGATNSGNKILDLTGALVSKAECLDAVTSDIVNKQSDIGGVMAACLSPANVLEAFGLWGILLAPIMAVSGIIAYFKSSVEGLVDIVLQRDQYQVVLSHTLPSPCLASAGICLGIRSGDIDGDGRVDEVGLTYIPGTCTFLGCSFTHLTIHVVLSTGGMIDYPVPPYPYATPIPLTDPRFIGLSDLDGRGRDEVVITYSGCADGCVYWAYELIHGQMQEMPFYGSPDAQYGLDQTFKCVVVKGIHQILTTYTFQVLMERHNEDFYQADGKGGMVYVGQNLITLQEAQQEGLVGANCPGLNP